MIVPTAEDVKPAAFLSASAPCSMVTARKPMIVPAAEDVMKPAAFPSASASTGTARKPMIVPVAEDAMKPAAFPSASATSVGTARKPMIVPAAEDVMLKPAAFLSASEPCSVVTARKPMIVSVAKDVMKPAAFSSASATSVGTARKPMIVPAATDVMLKPAALPSASATFVGTARKPEPVVDVPQPFVRRSLRLSRAAEMSAVSKIAANANIPLRASKRVPRAAQCVTPVTLSSCQTVDAVSMSSVESKTQVTSPSADLTLAEMNCSRCLKDADDDVDADDDDNNDDDDNERCVQTAKRLADHCKAKLLTGRGSMQATALKR